MSNLCHMDLSPDNIMLRSDKSNPWDTLRLIDFGFAAKYNPGKHQAFYAHLGLCHSPNMARLV